MSALPKWTTACPDWQTRIVKAQTLIPFAPLFHESQVAALETFDALVMVDAANSPTFGEVCRPWIRDFVAQIFGAYDPETGVRHITEFFLLISKKNGKSTTAAAIMLTALIKNWRLEAEFIILSPTKEVADNSFKPAAAMVRADPELTELLMVQDHTRTITHRVTGATLKVVAADSATVSGKKAVGILFDELWLFGKMANAEDMMREAIGGLASRPEGFVIYLTTQSNEPPTGVFKTKLEYARSVRDGTVDDPAFLPVIYEFPEAMIEADEHKLPENFYITNPNMGASVNEAFLKREYRKAQEEGEESVRGFLAKHLNVEIGMNLRKDRWPGAEVWIKSKHTLAQITIQYLINMCEVIVGGIDGGGLDDLLGLALLGRTRNEFEYVIPAHKDKETGELVPEEGGKRKLWLLFTHAWAHPSVLERRKDIESKLRELEKLGQLTLVDIIGQDVEELADMVKQVHDAGLLWQIGLDPNAIGGVMDAILQVGVDDERLVSVNQGYRLAGSIKTTERKLAEGVLQHGDTELMRWSVGNAKVKVVGNAIVVTKQVSGTAKIDPLMATFNAVQLMSLNPEAMLPDYDFDNMVIAG